LVDRSVHGKDRQSKRVVKGENMEEKLWKAVMRQAVEDLRATRGRGARQVRETARSFLRGRGTFSLACKALGVDPAHAREFVYAEYLGGAA
jgi:hypothetical protein